MMNSLGRGAASILCFATAAMLAAALAFGADAAPVRRPDVTGLSGQAAARVLSASGLRVLAIGLELAPEPLRATDAKLAPYPAAPEAKPGARPSGRMAERGRRPRSGGDVAAWSHGGGIVGGVVPPRGVRVVPFVRTVFSGGAINARGR